MNTKTWVPGSKSYAAGAGAGLSQPISDFIVNFGIWAGGDESWLKPLGMVVAIAIGFGLAYAAPQQQQIIPNQSVKMSNDTPTSTK